MADTTMAEAWCDRSGFMDPAYLTSEKGYNLRDRLNNLTKVERFVDIMGDEVFWFPDGSGIEIGTRRIGPCVWKWGLI